METTNKTNPKAEEIKVELDAHKASLEGKVYALNIGNEAGLDQLIHFIHEDAMWTNMEALGVSNVSKKLVKIKNDKEGIKSGNIFLSNLEIDAIHYFLGKEQGQGLDSAERYLKLIVPISAAIKAAKADTDKLNALEGNYAAACEGISVEPEVEKEATAEFDSNSDNQA